jgi:hypothetical protein
VSRFKALPVPIYSTEPTGPIYPILKEKRNRELLIIATVDRWIT